MDPVTSAALISGAANLIGGGLGFLGGSSANAQNSAIAYQQMQMQQNQFNEQMGLSWDEFGFQEALAQNSIRMRVNDAQQAGVSPLVALGAPSINMSPVSVGGTITGGGGNAVNPMSSAAGAMSSFGQDVSRAYSATRTPEEKALMAAQAGELASRHANDDAYREMLKAQANYYNSRAMNVPSAPAVYGDPGAVVSGQGNAGNAGPYQIVPAKIEGRAGGTSGVTAGVQAADSVERTAGGFYQITPARGSVAGQGDAYEAGAAFARNRLFVTPGTAAPAYVVSKMQMDDPTVAGGIHVGGGFYYPLHSSDYDAVRKATHPEGVPYQPF